MHALSRRDLLGLGVGAATAFGIAGCSSSGAGDGADKQRVQDAVTMLVVSLAVRGKDEATVAAADFVCQDLRRKLTGFATG